MIVLVSACGGSKDEPDKSPEDGGNEDSGNGDGDTPVTTVVACEDDSECSDTNACNGIETCVEGYCSPGDPVKCNDKVDCTRDFCDPVDGSCFHVAPDNDGDGHEAGNCVDGEDNPLGDDCDDADNNRFPGNAEVCSADDPGHDEDCDPQTYGDRDLDGDGHHDQICFNESDSGEITRGLDCNDGVRTIGPNNTEACDGFDNNCDGRTDEDLTIKGYRDLDGDGIGVPVTSGDLLPGDIVDGQGRLEVCPGTPGVVSEDVDCDDANPLIHKDMFELCDGIDNDCDGEVDNNVVLATWYRDADADGFGNSAGPIQVSCSVLVGYSLYPNDCDDGNALSNPNQLEICDGKDNDCDGSADFQVGPGNMEDDDGDSSADPACGTPAPDCDDSNVNVRPGAPELCDGLDNDCNGVADTQTQAVLWYVDSDGDGWGNPLVTPVDSCDVVGGRVTKVGDCDDRDSLRNPGMKDDCTGVAGYDDNCDGQIDEDEVAQAFFRDFDGDGYGKLASDPLFACQKPAGWSSVSSDCDDTDDDVSPLTTEVCTPGDDVDDDCDGSLDCADSDCDTDADCLSLFEIKLESPALPVVSLVAHPFSATVSVKNSVGTPQALNLTVSCKDGAHTTTPAVATDGTTGEASLTLYAGLEPGLYECDVADAANLAIPLKISIQAVAPQADTVHTVYNLAGLYGYGESGASALGSSIISPRAVEVGADGTAYILDQYAQEIMVVSPRGVITPLFASQGLSGSAVMGTSYAMALDRENNVLYIGTQVGGSQVLQYNLNTDGSFVILGGGSDPFTQGMSGTEFDISDAYAMHYREGIGLAVADADNRQLLVRADGTVTEWPRGTCGDPEGPRIADCRYDGCGIALTETGAALSLANWCPEGSVSSLPRIIRQEPNDAYRTFLTSTSGGGNAVPIAQLAVGASKALDFDAEGNLLVVDANRVRFVGRNEQVSYDIIGGAGAGSTGDYGPATSALLSDPRDIAVAPDGSIWIVTTGDRRVRRVWRPSRTDSATSVSLSMTSEAPTATLGYPATAVSFSVRNQSLAPLPGIPVQFESIANARTHEGPAVTSPGGIANYTLRSSMVADVYDFTATVGDIHGVITDSVDFQMTVSEPADGYITSLINHAFGSSYIVNNSWAPSQSSSYIRAVAARDDGTIFLADYNVVFAIHPDGSIERFAGGGNQYPDGVSFLSAQFGSIYSMTVDNVFDRLYLTDSSYQVVVLELDAQIVTMIEDGGTTATTGTVSPDGTEFVYTRQDGLYVADMTVYPPSVTKLISTVTSALTNCTGFPNRPYFYSGHGLAYGTDGLVYVMGSICTGSGSTLVDALYTVDTTNIAYSPVAFITHDVAANMAFDDEGWLYYANYAGDTVNRWNGASPQLVAGSLPDGRTGDLGPATDAQLNGPTNVCTTIDGDLLIADYNNRTVRRVWIPASPN